VEQMMVHAVFQAHSLQINLQVKITQKISSHYRESYRCEKEPPAEELTLHVQANSAPAPARNGRFVSRHYLGASRS